MKKILTIAIASVFTAGIANADIGSHAPAQITTQVASQNMALAKEVIKNSGANIALNSIKAELPAMKTQLQAEQHKEMVQNQFVAPKLKKPVISDAQIEQVFKVISYYVNDETPRYLKLLQTGVSTQLTTPELKQINEFYLSDLGRRIAHSLNFKSAENYHNADLYLQDIKSKHLSNKRIQLISKITQASEDYKAAYMMTLSMMEVMIDVLHPEVANKVSATFLENKASDIALGESSKSLYYLRNYSDQELTVYLGFLKSTTFKKFNNVMFDYYQRELSSFVEHAKKVGANPHSGVSHA